MAQKQQILVHSLNKLVRQHFVFHEEYGKDTVRVRMRSDLHRVEQAPPSAAKDKLRQRLANNKIGLLNPQNKTYVPVGGWPVLHLDDLVLNTMASHLDPKVRQALRTQLDRTEIKRALEKRRATEILNDYSSVHQNPDSGFHNVRTHVAESEARMQVVRAGFNYEDHFTRTMEERRRREAFQEVTVKQITVDPDLVLSMERVRRDMILFLVTLKDLLEKLLLLKTRHLKSHTPINLAMLGTDKDRTGHKSPGRHLQYFGGPPLQHNFKEQILMERPVHWPVKTGTPRGLASRLFSRQTSHVMSFQSDRPSTSGRERRKYTVTGVPPPAERMSESYSLGGDNVREEFGTTPNPHSTPRPPRNAATLDKDRDMVDKFRKIWPPVWMSLASMEQGSYIVDPACPTKEYNLCLGPPTTRRRKSVSDILETRHEWARMRKQVSKTLDENLWREDREKMEFYRVEYTTLSHLPLSKPYQAHQRDVEDLLTSARHKRQQRVIYDCELSEWYKYLVERVREEVGKTDEEIEALLQSIKVYFNMSATSPKMGKAKLALITMSLPAYAVCHVHVQRALTFILTQVLQAPGALLTGWLAARGLPLVLLKTHAI